MCDWKSTLEWTTPLLQLRLHLRVSFLGDIFWKTAGVSMLNVSKNIHQAIGKLNESPIIVPSCLIQREMDKNDEGEKDEKPAGDERKISRRKSLINTLETTPQNPQNILEKRMKKDLHEKYWRAVAVTVDGRKAARKDLRSFLRIFRRYHELPIDGKLPTNVLLFIFIFPGYYFISIYPCQPLAIPVFTIPRFVQ